MTAQRPQVQILPSSVEEVRRHCSHLFQAHAEEAEPACASLVDINWPAYRTLESAGNLLTAIAWLSQGGDEVVASHGSEGVQLRGVAVGYAVAFIHPSPHYANTRFAQHDLIYVEPGWRRGRVGLDLVREIERQATVNGASWLLMHAKPSSRFLTLLPRLGFRVEETVFRKELHPTPPEEA